MYWYPSRDIQPVVFDDAGPTRRRTLKHAMNPQEPYLPRPPFRQRVRHRQPRQPPPRGPSSFERGMARSRSTLLRERRADRRWRVFFRLAWLILFIIVAWSLFVGRGHGGAPQRSAHRVDRSARRDRGGQRGQRRKSGGRPERCVRRRRVAGRGVAHQHARAAARCRRASSTTRSGA